MNIKNVSLTIMILCVFGFAMYYSNPLESSMSNQDIFGGSDHALTEFQKDIVKKIRGGNIAELSVFFGEEVSLDILDVNGFYRKKEAENRLLTFCQMKTPKQFFVKHHGISKTETHYYLIGELITTTNEKFRVYISNSKTSIESIEITLPRDI